MLGPVCARKAQPNICRTWGHMENGERFSARRRLASPSLRSLVWSAFRAGSRDLLGSQPLPGSIVVLVNNLARTGLPLVATRAE